MVSVGGYPPMATLRWAPPGWPMNGALTPLTSPDAARLALRAESETSVLDPVGMRRLWLRDLNFLLAMALVILMLVAGWQLLLGSDQHLPRWWLGVATAAFVLNSAHSYGTLLWRAVPRSGLVPRRWTARWRWYRRVWREPVPVPAPPAAWPPGSEAYALLSAAASVEWVTLGWLCERVGMSSSVGAQWVTVLSGEGWLTGGGSLLGFARLPEVPVVAREAGRERLALERARLERLARS